MSRDVITLQPEVEELLREIARRPGSSLLRVPRKDVARVALERRSMVHAHSAELNTAERELVRVHREELAFALRQAAYRQLAEISDARSFVIDRAIPSRAREIPSVKTVRMTATAACEGTHSSSRVDAGIALLARCVSDAPTVWPDAATLAAASHRLVPTLASRVYVSTEMRRAGQPRSAVAVLRGMLECGGPAESMRATWCNLADACMAAGDYVHAHKAARAVEAQSDRDFGLLLNRLLSALHVGATDDARACVIALDRGDLYVRGLGMVPQFLKDLRTGGGRQFDAAQVGVLRSLRRNAGPNGEEILDALIS